MSGYKELSYSKKSTVDSISAKIQYKEVDFIIYVKIDVASQKHDYFFLMSDKGEAYTRHSISIHNTNEGYKKLHKSIQDFCGVTNNSKVRIGLESTGFYHKNIVSYLLAQDYEIMIINPLQYI